MKKVQKLEITNKVFNDLYVLGKDLGRSTKGTIYWICLCICGNLKSIAGPKIVIGHTKSCGCLSTKKKVNSGLSRAQRHAYGNYQQHARMSNRKFEISLEDFLIISAQNCHYCGCLPSNKVKNMPSVKFYTEFAYNGLDRVNNLKGYELDNVVPCCFICNRAKSSMCYTDFVAWLDRIASYRGGI